MHHPPDSKSNKFSWFFVYILTISALLVFLYGFFPLKCSSRIKNNRYNANTQNLKSRHIDKLAFIVIDALRHDFVKSDDQKYMPFTLSSILNNEACFMLTKAHSPTVTMPRLKAITSGSVSTYIDVVLNFMTPVFEEDNFINIAASNGMKIVFYGDDTWLKLFPKSFLRSEGTNSFFTYDYIEVDENVTRHLNDEFKKNDWDIIILHYLGLDHIGHTEGPNSPLVIPKLIEMDDVVKRFNSHFKTLESQGLKTMLVVTGDHGMKDSGSHGGVTYPEVTVPLVSVGKPCAVLPGWPNNHISLQIDIAPTLSTAFGLPIPANSMGKIIPGLLYDVSKEDILKNLEINRLELSELRGSPKKDNGNSLRSELKRWLLDQENERFGKNITKKYFQTLNQISQELVSTNSDFKLFFIVFGVILIWASLIFLLGESSKQYLKPQSSIHWFFIIGTVLHSLSLPSTSFIEEEHQTWYFFWATFCILIFLEAQEFFKNLSTSEKVNFLISWVVIAVLHRVLRKLNQTGDKWAFLPDIKFYLHSEEGQPWLFCAFLLGLCLIFCCALFEPCSVFQLATFGISLLAVTGYRIATRNFKVQYLLLYPSSRGMSEVCIFWIFAFIFALQTAYNKTPFYLVWLVFISLFLRPHNIILLSIEVFISKKLYKFFNKPDDAIWNTIAHVWLGNVFYFYQGNGNSLSNVDVASGFVGVQTYNPAYAGVIIAAHTFNSFILAYILSPKSDFIFILLKVTPLAIYCTALVFQLHHLFIWSVFSPKLLYESSSTAIFLALTIVNHFLNYNKSPYRYICHIAVLGNQNNRIFLIFGLKEHINTGSLVRYFGSFIGTVLAYFGTASFLCMVPVRCGFLVKQPFLQRAKQQLISRALSRLSALKRLNPKFQLYQPDIVQIQNKLYYYL